MPHLLLVPLRHVSTPTLLLLLATAVTARAGTDADAHARRLAQLAEQKAESDAETAASNAETAKSQAALAALKAQIGDVSSGYTGQVDAKDKTGSVEAALLAALAVETAAKEIVEQVRNAPPLPKHVAVDTAKTTGHGQTADAEAKKVDNADARPELVVVTPSDAPTFQTYISYEIQLSIVTKAFEDAAAASRAADAADHPETDHGDRVESSAFAAAPPLAGADLALGGLDKILSFFRSDYSVQGVALSLDDSLLVHALAGAAAVQWHVELPATYRGARLPLVLKRVTDDFKKLSEARALAVERRSHHDAIVGSLGSSPSEKKRAERHASAALACKSAIDVHDAFMGRLTSPDAKGAIGLADLARDAALFETLETSQLLAVKLQVSGGAYYTKKNVWVSLGAMPIFHMGGVVASYVLFDGKSGTVLSAGVVPVHGGFVKANRLQARIEAAHPTQATVRDCSKGRPRRQTWHPIY